ncbi:Uncharacterized protein TCM_001788 [Theobroma cacao]|uniref:Uncharacterized protein n=1 Tax=Theobroma cacao TaxID=3641 RepID=A0A061DLG5_THECC|nr:Uncharacterized protein TCM_001788 [Theobroma cacao]
MLLTLGIIILALLGLIFAAIVISAFLICCNKVIRERLRGPLQVIETGQQGNLVQPPEKQQGVMPILAGSVIIYKNGETESNCTDCPKYLEEFKEVKVTCRDVHVNGRLLRETSDNMSSK